MQENSSHARRAAPSAAESLAALPSLCQTTGLGLCLYPEQGLVLRQAQREGRRGRGPRFSTGGQGGNAKFLVNGAASPEHAECELSLPPEIMLRGYA
jgi:hypothetical protein